MKDEKLFNEKVDEFVLAKIEHEKLRSDFSKIAKLTKMAIGMERNAFENGCNVLYSTTSEAKERSDKLDKTHVNRLERAVDSFVELYTTLAAIGESDRVEKLMLNRGLKLEQTDEDVVLRQMMDQKFNEKMPAMWDEIMGSTPLPASFEDRAKALIQRGVASINDSTIASDGFSGKVVTDAAEELEVKPGHLSSVVSIRVKKIKKGDQAADEAVETAITDAEALIELYEATFNAEKTDE